MPDVAETFSLVVVHDNTRVATTNVEMEVPPDCHVEVLVDGTLEYVSDRVGGTDE